MKTIAYHSRLIPIGLYVLLFASLSNVQAQSFENLNHLAGHNTDTYFSEGSKEQAETMATRCDSVMSFYRSLIDFKPTGTLLVLSPTDWSKYTDFPVYGMPHYYYDGQRLIVASDDNDLWKDFTPQLDQLPSELAQQISNTYSDKNGSLTMRGFFDLLTIHELGHAFHSQVGLAMQRKWMEELFSDILLHTYIAEQEPKLLPALTVFPKMVVSSTNKEGLKYTTLEDLDSNIDLINQQYPNNYGWYQCRWHTAAGNIYDSGGKMVLKKLWKALEKHQEEMTDAEFIDMLTKEVHPSVAKVYLDWE